MVKIDIVRNMKNSALGGHPGKYVAPPSTKRVGPTPQGKKVQPDSQIRGK